MPLHRLSLAEGLRRHAGSPPRQPAQRDRRSRSSGRDGGGGRDSRVLHNHLGAPARAAGRHACTRCRSGAGGPHRRRHRPVRAAGRGDPGPLRRGAQPAAGAQTHPTLRRRVPHRRAHHVRGVRRRPAGDRSDPAHRGVQPPHRLLADPQPRHPGRQHRQRLPHRGLHRPAAGPGRARRTGRRWHAAVGPAQGVLPRLQGDRPPHRRVGHRASLRRPGGRPGQLREGLQADLPGHRVGQQRLLHPLHRGHDRRRARQPGRRGADTALPARDLDGAARPRPRPGHRVGGRTHLPGGDRADHGRARVGRVQAPAGAAVADRPLRDPVSRALRRGSVLRRGLS